jgi:hypothetical protein
MHPTDELTPILKKLRLSGVLQTLDLRMRQVVDDDLSIPEFLLRLLTDEVERRDAKQIDGRLRRASFEHHKSLEDFDFGFNPRSPRTRSSTSQPATSSAGTRTSASTARPATARATSRRRSAIVPAWQATR